MAALEAELSPHQSVPTPAQGARLLWLHVTSEGPFLVVHCTARNGLGVANFLAASCLPLGSCFVWESK